MSSSLTIKPRRSRITLWSADDTNLEPIEELCEVVSARLLFAINQIPSASVELPQGIEIYSDKKSEIAEKIQGIVRDKAPLCLILEWEPDPMHHTTSKSNDNDPDFEWPLPGIDKEDTSETAIEPKSGSTNTQFIIFKGYASSYGFSKTASRINTVLHISHWATDLAQVSPYCPRSHCSNPAAFGMDVTSFNVVDLDAPMVWWTPFMDVEPDLADEESIWGIIKEVLESIVEHSTDVNMSAIGSANESYAIKMKKALENTEAHLAWSDTIINEVETLKFLIVDVIGQQAASTWLNTTIWDAVVNHYAGMFYYAIVPTVDKLHIIPTPNAIAKECIEITEDDIFEFSMEEPTYPVLGGCIVVAKDGGENIYGQPSYRLSHLWPPQEGALEESVGGPLLAVELPEWLQGDYAIQDNILDQIDICTLLEDGLKETPRMAEALKEHVNNESAQDTIAQNLVIFEYLSRVFANRTCDFTMPYRGDICPGACVHVKVDPVVSKTGSPVELYGVVSSVSLEYSQGSAHTTVSLTNIRDKNEYESPIYNHVPVFYDKVWSGTDTVLYELKQ